MAKKKTVIESSEKVDSFVAEKLVLEIPIVQAEVFEIPVEKKENEEILSEIPKKEEKKQEIGEKCDLCQDENTYIYCTRRPIRYYKCRNCGWQFKRVQKYSGT